MPLMNMVRNVSDGVMAEFVEGIQPSIMSYRELEKGKEFLSGSFKGTICPIVFVSIPLGCRPSEGPLKEV